MVGEPKPVGDLAFKIVQLEGSARRGGPSLIVVKQNITSVFEGSLRSITYSNSGFEVFSLY